MNVFSISEEFINRIVVHIVVVNSLHQSFRSYGTFKILDIAFQLSWMWSFAWILFRKYIFKTRGVIEINISSRCVFIVSLPKMNLFFFFLRNKCLFATFGTYLLLSLVFNFSTIACQIQQGRHIWPGDQTQPPRHVLLKENKKATCSTSFPYYDVIQSTDLDTEPRQRHNHF